MKNKLFHNLLLTICLSLPLISTAGSYNKMIVFGDSLSDTGNLATLALVNPKAAEFQYLNSPPYAKSFTNGPTAVVQLAELLKIPSLTPALYFFDPTTNPNPGTNFAVAGARAAGNDAIDLNAQIGAFLLRLQAQGVNAPSDALYILFIGGNDIRDMRDAPDLKAVYTILGKANQNILNNLSLLIASGARHIMVVNSPDIGKLPETKIKADSQHQPNLIKRASLFTEAYNQTLADTVSKIEKNTGVNLVLFDVFTTFNNIVKDSPSFLFSNAKNACFSSVAFVYYPICGSSQLDTFVYFDEIHPTRRVHERVGRAMFAMVPDPN
jgi:outer membrane lipase/esterase